MEQRLVKKLTLAFVLLCTAICISLCFLPQFTRWASQRIAFYRALQEEARMREEMSALELMRVHEQEISNVIREKLGESIRMAYMDEGKLSDVIIEEGYLGHEISIFFPGLSESSLNQYPIIGSTKHLKDMKVTEQDGGLRVAFVTDVIVEPVLAKRKGFCYVTLKEPAELYDKIVVVDAGHGGKMPGAVIAGVKEKTINLQIVKQLKKLMDGEKGVKVYYTRLSDRHVELENRVGLANELKADLFISVHQNALGTRYSSVRGTQVLYSESNHGKKNSKKLAQLFLQKTVQAFQSEDKGLVKGDRIYIIRNSKVPVSLVEVGFMTNQTELKRLANTAIQKKVAKGIHDGIMEALQKGY